MKSSKIEWTDATWNPMKGCSAVSPGCEHCYAAAMAVRFSGPGLPYEGLAKRSTKRGLPQWTGEISFAGVGDARRPYRESVMYAPMRWRAPKRIFVNSMSDLFHEGVTDAQIASVFGVMALTSRHTYQVLTKRPSRMVDWFEWRKHRSEKYEDVYARSCVSLTEELGWRSIAAYAWGLGGKDWPLKNVHVGVSVEDQQRAEERIPALLSTPATVRWLSVEPLLGPLSVPDDVWRQLDWVVVGGESGHGARAMDLEWARSVVEQCRRTDVPVFVKQLGGRVGHGPDISTWPEDLRVREFPKNQR